MATAHLGIAGLAALGANNTSVPLGLSITCLLTLLLAFNRRDFGMNFVASGDWPFMCG